MTSTRRKDDSLRRGWALLSGAYRVLATAVMLGACRDVTEVNATERKAIGDSLRALVTQAYDLKRPEANVRLLALYPDSGRVISAAAGRVTTSRAALDSSINGFWQRVGQNMQNPAFEMGSSYVDIITRDAAVMTFTYRIPHTTPLGGPHIVGGAWTTLWRRVNGRWVIVQEHLSDTPPPMAPDASTADSAMMHDMPGMTMPGMTVPPPSDVPRR